MILAASSDKIVPFWRGLIKHEFEAVIGNFDARSLDICFFLLPPTIEFGWIVNLLDLGKLGLGLRFG